MARVDKVRLFNKKSRDVDHSRGYTIVIDNNIEGIITSEFVVESSAQWEPILSVPDAFSGLENMMNMANVTVFKSGFFTRKYYTGGSYLEFSIDFRVVDWEGNTDIVNITNQLIGYTAPEKASLEHFGRAVDEGKKFVSGVAGSGKKLVSGEYSGRQAAYSAYSQMKETSNSLSDLGGQEVHVVIGDFWAGNLVIENVSAKYSKERTETGPLYADYSVKFTTREILDKGKIDKGFRSMSSRISFEEG